MMSEKEETSLGNIINLSPKWYQNAPGQKGEDSGQMAEEGWGGVLSWKMRQADFGGRESVQC